MTTAHSLALGSKRGRDVDSKSDVARGTLFGESVKTRLKEHLMEECNLHIIVRLPNSVFRPYASIGTNHTM
jgi:hypothetical protein